MIVVDTNVVAYLLMRGTRTAAAENVYKKDPEWAAPYLWRSEFRNILATYVRNGHLSLAAAKSMASEAESLMSYREFEVASEKVLDLAKSSGCTAYDCEFVVLAEDLEVSLVTSDRKLLNSFTTLAVSIDDFIV